ncbi:MAG: YHS domain-containing (seleno)protein [Bacteroidota bacterium]
MSQFKNTNSENVFLDGYDVVSYFSDSPAKGTAEISLEHEGATFYFSSTENLDRFKADPAGFMPQYGGYCATATSEGKLVPVDPENFKITDGRLFLFYRNGDEDTMPMWNDDEQARMAKADAFWSKGELEMMA